MRHLIGLDMGKHLIGGNPPIEVLLKKSGRAKRMSLRLSRLDRSVTLTIPTHVPVAQGLAFAEEKADWLRQHLADAPSHSPVALGALLPVEGQMLRLQQAESGRSPQIQGDCLLVPRGGAGLAARLQGFLKVLARERLVAASDHYASRLGRGYQRLSLRDTRSRWGSCTADAGLMYSWRLIMAPPDVLRYVAAHEVAHLQEMNHSPAFWALVQQLYGDYRTPRGWLRQHGAGLHSYRFVD